MNHFINFKMSTPDYLENIIDQALEMKHYPIQYARVLEGKNLYMLFQKTSTRTALSFAFGMTALGGQYLYPELAGQQLFDRRNSGLSTLRFAPGRYHHGSLENKMTILNSWRNILTCR